MASLCLCVWWDLSRKIGSFHWCFCRLCFGCEAEGRMEEVLMWLCCCSLCTVEVTGLNCFSSPLSWSSLLCRLPIFMYFFFLWLKVLTAIVTFINLSLSFAFSRSVIGHSIVHRVLLEYLTYADTSSQLVCTVHVWGVHVKWVSVNRDLTWLYLYSYRS